MLLDTNPGGGAQASPLNAPEGNARVGVAIGAINTKGRNMKAIVYLPHLRRFANVEFYASRHTGRTLCRFVGFCASPAAIRTFWRNDGKPMSELVAEWRATGARNPFSRNFEG